MTKAEETENLKKINTVLKMGTQESVVLQKILEDGSTTVRDLLPYMNYPCGPIRDLQKIYGIPLFDITEKRTKKVFKNGKEGQVTVKYKRYFLEKMAV